MRQIFQFYIVFLTTFFLLPQPASTLSYTYDALDRRVGLADHLGGAYAYAYDVDNRLTALTAPWGTAYSFGYDTAGRRNSLASTSGRASTFTYENGLLRALRHVQNGVTLHDLAYDYAVDGQLAGVRDLLAPERSLALAYDNLNRLTMVSAGIPVADGGTPVPVEDFTYDGTGNRLSSHLSNLYLSDNHNRLTEDADYTYTYDFKGNRVSRTAKSGGNVEAYTYNSVNKLTAYNSGDGTTASYHYDALGRRIAKVVDGVETAYVYDPWNPYNAVANDILLEYRGGTLTRRWLHGSRVDEPLAFEAYLGTTDAGTGAANEVYADRQGSILAVVDPVTGTVSATYTYDSFGQITQVTGVLQQPFAYTGREYDAETGLYYYRARHYDPNLGQFIQSDPIGFAAGDLNIYTYVGNDPFNWSDPSGLSSTDEMVGGAGSAAMAAGAMARITPGMVGAATNIMAMLLLAANISGDSGPNTDSDDDTDTADPPPPGCKPGGGGNNDGDSDLEPTPKTNPEKFGPVRGSPGKVNLLTGEIWVFDMLHKNHYEVYKSLNEFRKRRSTRTRSVWDDGRYKDDCK